MRFGNGRGLRSTRFERVMLTSLMTTAVLWLAACSQSSLLGPSAHTQVFEVESADVVVNGSWGSAADEDASGKSAAVAPDSGKVSLTSFDDALLPFYVSETSSLAVYLRVFVPVGGSSAIELGIDGATSQAHVDAFGRYTWVSTSHFPVEPGEHDVHLAPPAAGVRYDMVVLTAARASVAELEAHVNTSLLPPTHGGPVGPDEPVRPIGSDSPGYPDDPYYDDVRAFPGAEGFGANATGGRGGKLVFITNLKDSGAGSARAAFDTNGKRYIIPLVWGYVDLKTGITVSDGDLTYAGQFMPDGQGMVLRNVREDAWDGGMQASLYLRDLDNAILRYLKIYRGVNGNYSEENGDGITIYRTTNVILDHSAIALGTDENINVQGRDTKNVTIQNTWSINPINRGVHVKDLGHGAGLLVMSAFDVTLSHNYYYRTGMRAPLMKGGGVQQLINNYDYNNLQPMNINSADFLPSEQNLAIRANVIGNLRELGPISDGSEKPFGMRIWQRSRNEAVPSAYLEGNIHPGRTSDADRSLKGEWAAVYEGDYERPDRLRRPVDAPAVRTTSAMQAKDEILAYGGPSYVIRQGTLTNVRDPMLEDAARAAETGKGASTSIVGTGKNKNWEWPKLPEGRISVESFWRDYFDPWRDANHPGKEWDDYVGGYQVIEIFLNAWVPDFVALAN